MSVLLQEVPNCSRTHDAYGAPRERLRSSTECWIWRVVTQGNWWHRDIFRQDGRGKVDFRDNTRRAERTQVEFAFKC